MSRQRILNKRHKPNRESLALVFKRWSNKAWAVLATFHKVILIGTLCYSYNMLAQTPYNQRSATDTASIQLELEEVEAVGDSPSELESSSLVPVLSITSKEIGQAGYSTAEELLEYHPGMDIRQRGNHGTQADLTIQGGTFDQSLVLLNGINLSDPQTGHFQLHLPVDLSALSQAQVLAGSASRRYGTQAFTGAVNFETRPPDTSGMGAGIMLGQHRFYKAFLNAHVSGKTLSTMASASASGSDGYRDNTDFSTSHLFLHSKARIKQVKGDFMIGMNKRKFGANSFYSPRFQQQYEETSTGFAALKLSLQKRYSFYTLNAYFRRNTDYFILDRDNPDFYQNDHLTRVAGIDLLGRFSSKFGVTQTGILLRKETIYSTSLGEPLVSPDSVAVIGGISYSNSHSRNHVNLHLNHRYEGSWFSMAGGLMVHYNSDLASEPFLMPGMDIRIKLSERMDLFTSLSRSMRMPTFTDLFYQGPTNVGNPYLLPEKATTVELGIQRKNKQWHSAISSFYRQGRDLIDWVWLEDEKWHTRNLTEIDAAGGSFFLKHQPDSPASPWISLESWKLSYTFTYLTKVSEAYISRYLLDNLKHKISMASHFSIVKNFGLFLGLSFQDRNGGFLLYDEASGGTQEQAYQPFVLMDLKLSYSFKRFHLYLKSNNVLNADYYDIGNVIQPGRWSMAGIEFR